jgi:hypothetical protein
MIKLKINKCKVSFYYLKENRYHINEDAAKEKETQGYQSPAGLSVGIQNGSVSVYAYPLSRIF